MKEKTKNTSIQKENLNSLAVFFTRAFKYFENFVISARDSYWSVFSDEFSAEKKKTLKNIYPLATFCAVIIISAFCSLADFGLGIYPAGYALLSSVGYSRNGRFSKKGDKSSAIFNTAMSLSVFSGVIISCIFVNNRNLIYLLTYMLLFLIRSAVTDGKLNENVMGRIIFSVIFSMSSGLIIAALDRFNVKEIFSAVSCSVISPILTYLLSGFYLFSGGVTDKNLVRRKLYFETGLFTVLFLFLYSVKSVAIFGFSVSFIISVILVMFVSQKYGPVNGALTGVVCGLAQETLRCIPTLALAGFFSGLFFDYSVIMALMMSFIVSCGYCIYSGGINDFGKIAADFTAGILLYFPLNKTILVKKEKVFDISSSSVTKDAVNSAKKKLKDMSDAFSSLSEVFYTVSDTIKKPKLTETTKLVSDCFSEICSKCPSKSECWNKNYSESIDVTTLFASNLIRNGKIERKNFPEKMRLRCIKTHLITEKINTKFGEINGIYYKNNKTKLLAGEYSSVSRLIKNTAGEINRELEYNPALESKAKTVLIKLGISFGKVCVFGQREMKIDIYGILIEKINSNTDEILEEFENEFGFPFDAPDFIMLEESAVMRLKRKRKFALECAKSGCTKKGETVNGDSLSFFENDSDYFYTLLCDGMGSGREAAFTSRLASIFIEKLMMCASPKNVAFDMLNAFLMSKSDETFTTVDLFEMDLLSGDASFIKAGAAPTYVVRKDRVHKIESKTLPAGIIENMFAEKTSLLLKDGDYVIMASDGVSADENGDWFLEFLTGENFGSAGEFCDRIFDEAKTHCGYKDDISISVIKIMNLK